MGRKPLPAGTSWIASQTKSVIFFNPSLDLCVFVSLHAVTIKSRMLSLFFYLAACLNENTHMCRSCFGK